MAEELTELIAEVGRLRAELDAIRTELTVERINVVEPDGTLRMTISGASRSHGGQIEDVHLAHREGERPAGLIFFTDEGTECGGLVFGGGEQNGARSYDANLLFDRFRNDQAVRLWCADYGETWQAGLQVQDRPAGSLAPVIRRWMETGAMPDGPTRQAELDRLQSAPAWGPAPLRLFLGRDTSGNAALELRDGQQRVRLRISVSLDGTAGIVFLDEDGQVVSSLP